MLDKRPICTMAADMVVQTRPSRRLWQGLVLAAVVALFAVPAAHATTQAQEAIPGTTRQVVLVGNNWDGTTDILAAHTYERLDRVNVIPDLAEREAEIIFSPDRLGFYIAIRLLIGEGNHQFNDDVFTSLDGRTLFVSRP